MPKFSVNGLARLHRVLEDHVERGEVPGFAGILSCGEEVHVEALGASAIPSSGSLR